MSLTAHMGVPLLYLFLLEMGKKITRFLVLKEKNCPTIRISFRYAEQEG